MYEGTVWDFSSYACLVYSLCILFVNKNLKLSTFPFGRKFIGLK